MRENAREQSGRTTRTLAALAACARWHWQAANGEAGDCALQSSNGETAAHAKETYPNGNRTGHPRVAGTDPAECHLDRMEGGNTLSSDQRQPIMVEIRIQPRHTDRHTRHCAAPSALHHAPLGSFPAALRRGRSEASGRTGLALLCRGALTSMHSRARDPFVRRRTYLDV